MGWENGGGVVGKSIGFDFHFYFDSTINPVMKVDKKIKPNGIHAEQQILERLATRIVGVDNRQTEDVSHRVVT